MEFTRGFVQFFALLVVAVLLPPCPCQGQQFEATLLATRLPIPLAYRSAAFDGNDGIYLLGGFYNENRTLWRYSITANTIDAVPGGEPHCYSDQAVWAGDHEAFCLNRRTDLPTELWGLRPTSPATSGWLAATLPLEMRISKLLWDGGDNVYVIGGYQAWTEPMDTLFRYNKRDGVLEQVATLPQAVEATSAIWDATKGVAYIFGGFVKGGVPTEDILSYNATSGQTGRLAAPLPWSMADTCAMWTGTEAYILGGTPFSNQIVRFRPTGQVHTLQVTNMPEIHGTACQYIRSRNRIYIFGGRSFAEVATDAIYYIQL